MLAAQEAPRNQKSTHTFTSPDGAFRFNYSRALVPCRRHPDQTNRWTPDVSCNAYTPVCSNFSCDSGGTVACIAYPAHQMQGTNFQAAAFSVNVLKQIVTESECMKVDESRPRRAKNQVVNGVRFKVTETDGVGLGNFIDDDVYRTFHNGKCYELDVRIASSKVEDYEPGKVKSFDSDQVQRALKAVLASFAFLR